MNNNHANNTTSLDTPIRSGCAPRPDAERLPAAVHAGRNKRAVFRLLARTTTLGYIHNIALQYVTYVCVYIYIYMYMSIAHFYGDTLLVCLYIHTYIQTYIHTYIHTYNICCKRNAAPDRKSRHRHSTEMGRWIAS